MLRYNQRLYEAVRDSSVFEALTGILKKVSDVNDTNMDVVFNEMISMTPRDEESLISYRVWAHNILITYIVTALDGALSGKNQCVVLTASDLKACIKLGEILAEFEDELDNTEKYYLALLGLYRTRYHA